MPEITIMPLSLFHIWDEEKSIQAFAKLLKKSQERNTVYPFGLGFFGDSLNRCKVNIRYFECNKTLIEPYKLGKISTQDFLGKISGIFPDIDGSICSPALNQREYSSDPVLQCFAEAWNAAIGENKHLTQRFKEVVQNATADAPIYFTANTNELNIIRILDLLGLKETINIGIEFDDKPVRIADNVFLCLSYRYQDFKLMQYVIKNNINPNQSLRDNITVIIPENNNCLSLFLPSFADELKTKLAIPAKNIISPSEYFETTPESKNRNCF